MKLVHTICLVALVAVLGGCGKSSATSEGPASKDKTEAAADGTKLEAAYQSTFGDMTRKDGFDDKLKDLKAKIGEPQKTEGKYMYWYGWVEKGKYCREIKLTQGAGGMMSTADKAKCGK